jgi:hypothetical protein
MDQLAREDLILYLTGAYVTTPEKAEIEQKLKQSLQLVLVLEKLRQQIDRFRQENQKERELILAHLEDYLDGKITVVHGVDFPKFFAEHPDCKRIYGMLQQELTLEEAAKLDYPVSEQLAHKFDYLLADDLQASSQISTRPALSEKVVELIERIVLILTPMPEPAFLGETIKGEARVEITGNAFAIEVGAPGRMVRILSPDGKELEALTSDENGLVRFQDYEPDEYLIKVEGFKIQEVRRVTE